MRSSLQVAENKVQASIHTQRAKIMDGKGPRWMVYIQSKINVIQHKVGVLCLLNLLTRGMQIVIHIGPHSYIHSVSSSSKKTCLLSGADQPLGACDCKIIKSHYNNKFSIEHILYIERA